MSQKEIPFFLKSDDDGVASLMNATFEWLKNGLVVHSFVSTVPFYYHLNAFFVTK